MSSYVIENRRLFDHLEKIKKGEAQIWGHNSFCTHPTAGSNIPASAEATLQYMPCQRYELSKILKLSSPCA